MKTSMCFISVTFLFVASFLCAEELRVFSNEEITGTWVNPEYTGFEYNQQKYVLTHWGYYEAYTKIVSSSPKYKGTYQIIDKWTDSEGNTLYKSIVRYEGGLQYSYELGKISKDRSTWEYAFSYINYPTEFDLNPDNAHYRIYYRQE
jgi:hypothetical protein